MTRATVLVCTKDRSSLFRRCVHALAASLTDDDELVVVEAGDSGAAAALAAVREAHGSMRAIKADRPGKSHQVNIGIRAAKGEVIVMTDDDVLVHPTWVDEMVEPFADPDVGLVCGRVVGLSTAPGWTSHPIASGEAPLETWDFAHGAAMAVRCTAAWDAGGFDERLGPGAGAVGEDHDFVLRVREHGWKILVVESTPVVHEGWRTALEDRANALGYERGGGAVIGAAIRRRSGPHWRLLWARLGYQKKLLDAGRRFGIRGFGAFAGGLAYGLRLTPRRWISSHESS